MLIVKQLRFATAAALLASFVSLQPAEALAEAMDQSRGRRGRQEERARREYERDVREARRDYRRDVRDARRDYWDAARYYRRDDRRYRPRRLSRNDWIYRGSDNRYYCRRDDGTTGLIIGGVSGAVLGNIIAPGGAKVLGTIIGGGAGALIGRAIDDGDIVCR